MHHREVDRAVAAHGPADDTPIRGGHRRPELGDDVGPDLIRQVLGGVAPWAVHAFGVIVEPSAEVDEYQQRGNAAVSARVAVDHGNGVSSSYPVGGVAEFTGNHHDDGEL